MTPSKRHHETVARGPRRTFLLQAAGGLLAVLLAAPAPSPAQGLIEFSVGASTYTHYEVWDNGTGLKTLPFPQTPNPHVFASTQSSYPGGRQYLYQVASNRPTGGIYWNVWVWSEGTGQSKAVTNINGPLYGFGAARWSNDGLDSSVSFILSDSNGDYTYRAHVSASEIASPDFVPITLDDLAPGGRLELVKDWQGGSSGSNYWWNHSGSGFYYPDPRDGTKIRLKTVGVGVTLDDDPIVFIAPTQLSELRAIPPGDPLNPNSDRYLSRLQEVL